MKINLKQPKYVLPVILLPFFCLFFYVWHHSAAKKEVASVEKKGLNPSVADVSPEVRKKKLADKLDAYRNSFKEADGQSAVNMIPTEAGQTNVRAQADAARARLDSIDRAMKARFSSSPETNNDVALSRAVNKIATKRDVHSPGITTPKEKDPMEMFKQQLAYIDSMQKQNDPAAKAERIKKEQSDMLAKQKASEIKLAVSRAESNSADFNTVMAPASSSFLSAVVDENITGYAGSRLRLRLLDDIKAGENLVPKGTLLFAEINGFSGQRVTLKISSILCGGKILPVKLDVYDLDGLPGLYVPASAFRDFTKDLGSNSVQGISMDNSSSSFVMSTMGRMFQSTSSAIADMIRKNKARLKFNTYVYLIDPDQLHNSQKSY